jgi:hypothetical protein
MTDEHLAAMHRSLTEYHRKLAKKKAVLGVVQQYHADLAQRLADEAAQRPRAHGDLLGGFPFLNSIRDLALGCSYGLCKHWNAKAKR